MSYYSCKLDDITELKFFPSDKLIWLKVPDDFPLIREYYGLFQCGMSAEEITEADFAESVGRFCAYIENGKILSFAGALPMTQRNWKLGAASTHPEHRNRGLSTIVCSHAAKYILENGKQVTCSTEINNKAMRRVMHKIGMVMQ